MCNKLFSTIVISLAVILGLLATPKLSVYTAEWMGILDRFIAPMGWTLVVGALLKYICGGGSCHCTEHSNK